MDVPLADLYEQWKAADVNFERFLKDGRLKGTVFGTLAVR